MAGDDVLVLTPASDVLPGDYVWHIDDVYRAYDVDPDIRTSHVRIHLEACRHPPMHVPLFALIPVGRMT